jgi:hypothetical protein
VEKLKVGNKRVTTTMLVTGAVTKAKIADEVVEKVILSEIVAAGATKKWIADGAYTITHVTFNNTSGTALSGAASVTNAGNTVVSSTSNLAAGAVEEKEGASLANTSVADGAAVNLVGGTGGDVLIVVVMTKKVNV